MEKQVISMDLERETKGTYRYKEIEDKGGMPPVIRTVYIAKWSVDGKPPKAITLTLEEVK